MPADPSAAAPTPPATKAERVVAVAEGSGLPRNIAGGAAYLFVMIGGIVLLFVERRDRFVRFHAWQSIYLGALLFLISSMMRVAESVFGPVPLVGWLMVWLFGVVNMVCVLVWFVVWVVAWGMAFAGREWEVPYLGPLVRRHAGPRRR